MKIKDILNKVKANKNTYYNLDKKSIQDYKKLYNNFSILDIFFYN